MYTIIIILYNEFSLYFYITSFNQSQMENDIELSILWAKQVWIC